MTPTPEQVAQWAREAGETVPYLIFGSEAWLLRFAARAMAEQAESDVKALEAYQVPVGNSAAGEMAAEWTMEALREIRDAIRANAPKVTT